MVATRNAAANLVRQARTYFNTGATQSLAWRLGQLKALKKMIMENEDAIVEAQRKDLRKAKMETVLTETFLALHDIDNHLANLAKWMRPKKPSVELPNMLDKCQVQRDALGVVLILGAWNYPTQLTLCPLIGAISGGNAAVIKPSELSPATAELLAELVPKYLDADAFHVYNGGIPETTALLEERFDLIFYTGGSAVAKIICAAAAKYLTPTVLELGGKSPAIVSECGSQLKVAAQRVVWGKMLNTGQSCIAPDYCLVTDECHDEFVAHVKDAIVAFYGEDAQQSPDLGRIVNERHFDRIAGMLKGNVTVAHGGKTDRSDLYIEPTVLTDVTPKSDIMGQEIFGPVLPIIRVPSVDDALDFVNANEKPLALYVFSNNQAIIKDTLARTTSGSAVANDTMMQAGVLALPFGGVGNSGMGAYHGKHSFNTFTHKRAVMHKDLNLEVVNTLRYPPYSEKKLSILSWVLGYPHREGTGMFTRFLTGASVIGAVLGLLVTGTV